MDKEQLVFNSLLKASSDNAIDEARYYDKNDLKRYYSREFITRQDTDDNEPRSRLDHLVDAGIQRRTTLGIEAARDEHEIRPDTSQFTPKEKLYLNAYKGVGSTKINKALVNHHNLISDPVHNSELIRSVTDHLHKDHPEISHISSAITKGAKPLLYETHVFSGTGRYDPSHLKEGSTLHTPAFTSTSLDPAVSRRFSEGHILHFILPKGYNKGMLLDPHNTKKEYDSGSEEREYLLDRGQKWKCVGKETVKSFAKRSFHLGDKAKVKLEKHNIYHLVPHDSNINEAVIHSLVGIQHAVDHPTADSLTLFGSNPHKASLETQHKELAKLHDHKLIPETGRQSLAVYTDTSEYINKPLVSPESYIPHIYAKESKEHTDHISDAISRMPAHDKDIHVYSGTGGFDPSEHIAHGHIHLPAFTSTSLVPNVAATFANWPAGHVMHFILPKGYNKGIYVGHNSNCDVDEREYILDKNQTFKHVGSEHIKSNPYSPGAKREVTFHSFVPISHTVKEAYEHDTSRLLDRDDFKDTRSSPSTDHEHEHYLLDKLHGPIKPDIPGFDHFDYSSRVNHCGQINPGWDGMNQYAGQSADINRDLVSIHKKQIEPKDVNGWISKKIHDVDTYLGDTKPLTREHHVYAGLGSFNPETIMKHKKFVMPGFVSTSIDPHVSNVHNNLKGGASPEHTLHIILPKGYTGGRYIATGPSSFMGEHEITLKRGQRFKFHNKEVLDVGGKTRTIWTVKPLDHLNGKKSKQVKIPLDESTYHEPAAFIYGMKDKWSKTNLGVRKTDIDHDVEHQHQHLMNRQYEGIDDDRDVSSLRKIHQPTIDYTSSSIASSINHRLIDKDSFHDDRPNILTNHIKMYSKALDHEMHVYSGVSSKFFDLDEGSVVHTPAFTSTSLHPNIAKSFSETNNTSKGDSKTSILERHVLHFILPKGYNKGMYIGGVSNHKGEFEYLLDKNQKWKVLGTHRKSDVTYPEYDEDKKYIGHTRIVHLIPHDEHVTEAYKGLTTPENNDVFSQHNHALFEPGNVDYYKFQSIKDQNPEVEPRDIVDQHHFLHSIHSHDFEPKHVDVINNYTKGGSGIINHFLIHGPQNPIRNYSHEINSVNHLDDMFASVTPIDHNVHSYSSIGFDPSKIMKEHDGIFKTPAFISSSLNPHVAVDFNVLKNTSMGDHHVVHYDLPKGYTGASYIGGSTPKIWSHQRELLIDRDRMFKLHKRTVVSGPSHSVTVWHVKPYDHVIKEALTHIFDRFDSGNFSRQVTNQDSDAFIFGELVKEHEPLNSAAKEQFAKVKHKMTLNKFSYDGNSASVEDVPHHIHNYTTTDSGIVNHYLIHGGKHNNRYNTARNIKGIQGIPRLKSELNHLSTPLPEDHHVYSALVQFSPEKHFKQNNGVIKMPGFTSTSINPYFVSNWGGIYDEKKSKVVEQHILHFHLPKGYTGGAYVAPHSAHRNEREFLLKPNQKWRLTDHNVATGGFKDDTYHPPIDRHIWSVEPYDNTHLTEALKHDTKLTEELISEMDFHSKYLFKDVGGTTGMTYEPWNTKESKSSYAKKIKNLGSFKQAVNMRADARSIEEYNKYVIPRSGLNPIQNRHLDDYVGSHSRLINFVLLHKHSRALGTAMHTSIGNTLKGNYDHISYYHDHINSISDVIRDHAKPLEEETHVYSGLSNFDPRKHFAKSKIVKFPSFISTSFKPATAVAFANRNDANRSWKMDAHIVHFHLPAGYKNGISPPENISEREFILNKGQKWRLVKHEIVNNKNHDTLDENNPLTGPKLKKKYVNRKIHIYTVVPHEDNKLAYHEPMNEAYDHNISSSAFKDFKNSTNEDFYDITGRKAVKKEHESLVKQNLWIDDHKNKEHLYSFTNDSSEINKGLIHKTKFAYSGTKETHQGMQKLFNDAKPLEREHHVYSGLGLFSPEKSLEKHGVFTTPAYISSSINPHVAISHTNYKRVETDRIKIPGLRQANRKDLGPQTFDIHEHVMHFILPRGYNKGIYAGGYSDFHGEHEMILNRGQKWKTVNHEVVTKTGKVDRWMHNPYGYGKYVKDTHNIHRHIWSVIPHEEDLKESLTYDDHGLKSEWDHLDNETPLHVKDHHEESMHLMNQHKAVIDHETEEGRNKQRDQFIAMIRHTASSTFLNRKLIMDGEDSLQPDLISRHTNLKDYLSDTKPLEEVHHVYSSMGSFDPGTIITKDKIFKTPAYVSTSLNPHTAIVGANIFAQRSSGIKYSNEHILHIELPKGYVGGRYLGSHSNYPLEQEFLLRPNQRLKITDKTSISGPNGRMRHVWHAKPLDHLNGVINESTYHDPDVFRQFTSNRDTPSQKVRDFSANLVDKRKASTKDYKKQHFTLLIDRNQHTPLVSGEGNNYGHLYRYTSHAASINNYLIEHHNDPDQYKNIHTEKDIENISGQIKALGHPLHEEMHVYSGIKNLNLHKAFKQHEGIIHTPAFTSTSINPMTARSFAGSDGSTNLVGQNERHVIHFHLPKGYRHGVYVGDISEFENENEFLLNKGQKWKLVNHQRVNDVYHSKYTDPAKKIISPYHIWSVVPHEDKLNEEILNEIEYKKAYFWNSTPKPGVNPKREEDYQTINLGKNITTRKLSDEEFKAHVSKTISHEEQSSVSHYMGAGSRSINAKLLNDHGIKHNIIPSLGNGFDSEAVVSHHLNHLDNAFKYHTIPLKQDMEVYSGISGYNPRHIVDNHDVFATPAFTSTSFHPGTSIWMAGRHNENRDIKHIIHFKLPKGYSKGLVTSNGHDEHEMILNRDQNWKVVDHKTVKNYNRSTHTMYNAPRQTTTHIWSVVPHDK